MYEGCEAKGPTILAWAESYRAASERVNQLRQAQAAASGGTAQEVNLRAEARAERVFEFVRDYRRRNGGSSPTLREIMAGAQVSSTSVVWYTLGRLAEDGRIRRPGNRSRAIEVVGEEEPVGELERVEAALRAGALAAVVLHHQPEGGYGVHCIVAGRPAALQSGERLVDALRHALNALEAAGDA